MKTYLCYRASCKLHSSANIFSNKYQGADWIESKSSISHLGIKESKGINDKKKMLYMMKESRLSDVDTLWWPEIRCQQKLRTCEAQAEGKIFSLVTTGKKTPNTA